MLTVICLLCVQSVNLHRGRVGSGAELVEHMPFIYMCSPAARALLLGRQGRLDFLNG